MSKAKRRLPKKYRSRSRSGRRKGSGPRRRIRTDSRKKIKKSSRKSTYRKKSRKKSKKYLRKKSRRSSSYRKKSKNYLRKKSRRSSSVRRKKSKKKSKKRTLVNPYMNNIHQVQQFQVQYQYVPSAPPVPQPALPPVQKKSNCIEVVVRDNTCSVCLGEFNAGDRVTQYGCGHQIHKECHEIFITAGSEFAEKCPSKCTSS